MNRRQAPAKNGSEQLLQNDTYTYLPSSTSNNKRSRQNTEAERKTTVTVCMGTKSLQAQQKLKKKKIVFKPNPVWLAALLYNQYTWCFEQIQWPHEDTVPVGGSALQLWAFLRNIIEEAPFPSCLWKICSSQSVKQHRDYSLKSLGKHPSCHTAILHPITLPIGCFFVI